MQFEFYQWLVPLIGASYLFRIIFQYKRNVRSLTSAVVWGVFWATIILLALIPNPVSFKIAQLLGFKSNINAVIFVALGWLFLLVFYLSNSMDKMERQMTELVRKIAMDEQEKTESKKPNEDPEELLP